VPWPRIFYHRRSQARDFRIDYWTGWFTIHHHFFKGVLPMNCWNMKSVRWVSGVLSLAALLCACSTTYEARSVTPSGFLGDYSGLKKINKDDPALLCVNAEAVSGKYDRIMIDPIQIYGPTNGALAKLSKEDQQRLVNYLDASLRVYLASNYTFVTQSGPDVMRLRMAITEAKGANVPFDIVSSVVPIGLAVSFLKEMATGAHTAVGKAGLECEGLDSVTGQRLFAFVDARVGRKVTGRFDKLEKWHTVQDAFDFWARQIADRLQQARAAPKSAFPNPK
jgi:hypothetical protein